MLKSNSFFPVALLVAFSAVTLACSGDDSSSDAGGDAADDHTAPDAANDQTAPDAAPDVAPDVADATTQPDAADADATTTTDAGDAGDAGDASTLPPEGSPCTTPNEIQQQPCGYCGTQERACLVDNNNNFTWGAWGYCQGQPPNACDPNGPPNTGAACGNCGTMTSQCLSNCTWDQTATCVEPTDACKPDSIEFKVGLSCQQGGRAHACDSSCAWEDWTDCIPIEGFETCPNGWTLSGDWQCGTPTPITHGPSSAYNGTGVLATKLASNYTASDAYGSNTAVSPSIDLTTSTAASITFQAWKYTESGAYDGFNVSVSTDGGATYTLLTTVDPAYNGTVGGQSAWYGQVASWQPYTIDLTAYLGKTINVQFAFRSDSSAQYPGIYIDDFTVIKL
jgi:hypothetical protein